MTQVLSFANGVMKFGDGNKNGQRLTKDEALEIVGGADEEVVDANGNEVNDDNNGDPNKGADGNVVTTLTLPEDFDKMTVDDLRKFAVENDIDLGDATLKDDIKKAIVNAVDAQKVQE